MILFVPALFIANNLWFGGAVGDIEQLDDDYIAEYEADDPRLIEHIRKHYLVAPASRSTPYNLNEPNRKDYSFKEQSGIVAYILHNKRNGFFLEAGGYDGEQYSNTLYLEKSFNWTGILVEPDPVNIKRLLAKNRKAWLMKGCVHDSNRPQKMTRL